jgi:hypothetical protein
MSAFHRGLRLWNPQANVVFTTPPSIDERSAINAKQRQQFLAIGPVRPKRVKPGLRAHGCGPNGHGAL